MKKEIVAVGILVFILIMSLFNIWFINDRAEKLTSQIQQAGELLEQDDAEKAMETLKTSLEDWKRLDKYVRIMLRQEEINPITEEYYVLLEELENGNATSAGFESLMENLERLANIERLSLSSIF